LLYGVFGLTAAGADFLAFKVLREIGLGLLSANVVSVNLGIAISFACNAFLNFRRTDVLGRRALVFFGVGWTGLCLSSLILWLGVERMGSPETLVKAGSIVIVAAVQFTLNKLVTFRLALRRSAPATASAESAESAEPGGGPAAKAEPAPEPGQTPPAIPANQEASHG
jgi:putative flippase GtrA